MNLIKEMIRGETTAPYTQLTKIEGRYYGQKKNRFYEMESGDV